MAHGRISWIGAKGRRVIARKATNHGSHSAVSYSIGLILIHLAVSFVHGFAHGRLEISLNAAQKIFIDAVIVAMPLIAGFLLWKNKIRAGGALLSASMAGGLIFGIYYHFIAPGADNVNHQFVVAMTNWKQLFDGTAIGIAALEAFGTICGLRLVLKSYRQS
jgi:cytochrome bd-type quinol oxidase subunit 2